MRIGFRGMGKLMVEKRRIELLIVLPATLRLWIPVSLAWHVKSLWQTLRKGKQKAAASLGKRESQGIA